MFPLSGRNVELAVMESLIRDSETSHGKSSGRNIFLATNAAEVQKLDFYEPDTAGPYRRRYPSMSKAA